jgi:hypothetical protein
MITVTSVSTDIVMLHSGTLLSEAWNKACPRQR